MKRLGLANHGALVWKGLSKGLETPIDIDIVNHQGAICSHGCPCSIQLESYVAFAVQAVVNEEINLAQSGQQPREPSPARTLDI
jgi:hypothetical protein